MLSWCSGILVEAISIAFTYLQQRQSISLAFFQQFPHLQHSIFPILICNKTAAEAYVQFQKWRRCSAKKDVLKIFANFTGKHLCWSLFLIKIQVFRPVTLSKRDSNTAIFLKFAKFLRTSILKDICKRLLLQFLSHGICVGVSS